MTGKMLRRGQNMFALHSANERRDIAADILWIFAEASRVDHRIVGIDVDVGHWRENLIDPDRPRLLRYHTPLALSERRIAGRGDGHRRRPGCCVRKAHPPSGPE